MLSVLCVTSFAHPNSPVRSSHPHSTDVETEAQGETRDTGLLDEGDRQQMGNFSVLKKAEQIRVMEKALESLDGQRSPR